jgi:hypothetical protein
VRRISHPSSRLLVQKLDARHFDLPPLRELRAALHDGDATTALVHEATEAFNAGDYARAVSSFRDAVGMHPGYADLHAKLGWRSSRAVTWTRHAPRSRARSSINPE